MHSLPMLLCHRLRADVMAPGELGGCAAHHPPANGSPVDLGDWLGEVGHHQLQGRVIISRAPVSYRADGVPGMAGYWSRLALPAGTAATTSISIRKSGRTRPGITPSMKAGLWVMDLLRTST